MRVAIYARVSANDKGQDPENQLRNCCDGFGYIAISYEEPPVKSAAIRRPSPPRIGSHWSA